MKQRILIGICLAAAVTASAPSGGAKTFPLKASVPARATVESFMNRRFRETVTCQAACNVKTSVVIRASAAKRLGFKNVRRKLVVIATNKATLKARAPTRLSLVLTAEAKRRLGGRKAVVTIFGSVRSVPLDRPTSNYSVGWASKLA